MNIDSHLPELTVAQAEHCFMLPADVLKLAVGGDADRKESRQFLNNISDRQFVPFWKSGTAKTSPRLYSAIGAVMLRAMWEITRSGRTYEFAAPIAQKTGLVAREMIDQSRDIDAVDEGDWLVVYRTSSKGQPERISRIKQAEIAAELSIGGHDIGVLRAGAFVVNVLRHYSGYWEKDRRARGLSMPPARYHGVDDQGLPLDPDHEIRHYPDDLQVCGNHTPVPPSKELYPVGSHPMA